MAGTRVFPTRPLLGCQLWDPGSSGHSEKRPLDSSLQKDFSCWPGSGRIPARFPGGGGKLYCSGRTIKRLNILGTGVYTWLREDKLSDGATGRKPLMLALAPTRELARLSGAAAPLEGECEGMSK